MVHTKCHPHLFKNTIFTIKYSDRLVGVNSVSTFQAAFEFKPKIPHLPLSLCLLGNYVSFLSSADFFKINLFKKFFQEYHQCCIYHANKC